MSGGRVALLCGNDDVSAAVANALVRSFGPIDILVEEREPKSVFLKRRAKRLGFLKVLGQIAFVALAVPSLRRRSSERIRQIVREGGLDLDRSRLHAGTQVRSINSPEAREWLSRMNPAVVVVNGTRIIGKRTLTAVEAPIINTHCGITPEYRGSHGGYWAMATGDKENCGVTVHLVDSGIDTGGILAQARIEPTQRDNFVTLPYLQIAAALPLLVDQVQQAIRSKPQAFEREGPSRLWYHPTLAEYLATGIRKRVW